MVYIKSKANEFAVDVFDFNNDIKFDKSFTVTHQITSFEFNSKKFFLIFFNFFLFFLIFFYFF
jgi:hypothetical protein